MVSTRSIMAIVLVLGVAVGGCSEPRGRFTAEATLEELLADSPDFPTRILVGSSSSADKEPDSLHWRVNEPLRTGVAQFAPLCGQGTTMAARSWTNASKPVLVPELEQFVCRLEDEQAARKYWEELSLVDVLGEKDYVNIDPSVRDEIPDRRIRPSQWQGALVEADNARMACLSGNADAECYDWVYLGRYGVYTVQVLSRVGMSYEHFLEFVQSIDDEIAQRLLIT